jgi:drug/metabolite transporter (DMT)-like permease
VSANTAVLFGPFTPPSRSRRKLSPRVWTCVGTLAIPLWATWPALALRTLEMPAFECLTIAFLVGWIVVGRMERIERAATSKRTSWKTWIPAAACAFGLTGNNAFHILATRHIPAAEANMISYLWPVMIVALGAMLGEFKLRPRQVAAVFLGFAGAMILMGVHAVSLSFVGMALAFLSGLSWAMYCVFRLKYTVSAGAVLTRGCAISALLCAIVHIVWEPTVVPSAGGLAAAAAVGILPLALGNLVWDEGFRRGDRQLLAVMAYATPFCGALLLALLGLEAFTWRLCFSAIVIVVAGNLSRVEA